MHKTPRPLALILYELSTEKLFIVGLFLKLLLISIFIPEIQIEWFLKFIVSFIEQPTLSPWSNFVETEGDALAFPYGPIMMAVHLPTTFIGWFIDELIGSTYFAGFGFRLSLLICDFWVLIQLVQQSSISRKKLLLFYWLSPLVMFINYWHGQTDIVPVMFLMLSLSSLKSNKSVESGVYLALGAAAKHTIFISLPFIFLYLWFKRGISSDLRFFLFSFIAVFSFLEFPFVFTHGFIDMVLQNRELKNLFWVSLQMSDVLEIYLIPIAYFLLCYYTWYLRRMNHELLLGVLGVAFGIVVVASPAPPGWYLWLIPMFSLHLAKAGKGAIIVAYLFSVSFVALHFITTKGSTSLFSGLDIISSTRLSDVLDIRIISLVNTGVIGMVVIILYQMFRDGIVSNDFFVLGRRPFAIGIAGDSGTGKTTLVDSLSNLLGKPHVIEVHGDNYHKWDRHSSMWKTMTHLDPRANDEFRMLDDVRSFLHIGHAKTRTYDHSSGFFTPFEDQGSQGFIIVDGLHALHSARLRELYDVRIFLSLDESMRRELKIYRDVNLRGKSLESTMRDIERRHGDSLKYIEPQARKADLCFHVARVHSESSGSRLGDDSYILTVRLKDGSYYLELSNMLIGLCGLQVDMNPVGDDGSVEFDVQGDVSAEDIALASRVLVPHFEELINYQDGFANGVSGLMQLIILLQAADALNNRRS